MKLTTRLITPADARALLMWRYAPPYDVYNFAPSDELDIRENVLYITDPSYNFYALEDAAGELAAFCSFGEDGRVGGGDYSADALDIGMGVHPKYTGQGQGHYFRDAVLLLGKQLFQPRQFRVTIAAFNTRAQRLWQKAGFEPVQSFEAAGKRPFVIYTVRTATLNLPAN